MRLVNAELSTKGIQYRWTKGKDVAVLNHKPTKVLRLSTPTAVAGYVFTSVCLCVRLFFCTISPKPMQPGSPDLTYECCTMGPGNLIYFGVKRSKVKFTSHKNVAGVGVL